MKISGNWVNGFSVSGNIKNVRMYHSAYDLLEGFLPESGYENNEDFIEFLRNDADDADVDFLLIDDSIVLYLGFCGSIECTETIDEMLSSAIKCFQEDYENQKN